MRPFPAVFAFEESDDALTLLPLAARRACDAAGLHLPLAGWQRLDLAARKRVVALGASETVESAHVTELVEKEATGPCGSAYSEAENVEEVECKDALLTLLWPNLPAFGRWVLRSLSRRGKAERLRTALQEMAALGVSLSALFAVDPELAQLLDLAAAETTHDAAHSLAHALRVAEWCLKLSPSSVLPREAVAAALLHDIVNVPKDSPDRSRASQFSADRARVLLLNTGFAPVAIERIAEAIEDHSFSRGAVPRSELGDALQDADRLEALGALGVFRVASTATLLGSEYVAPADPWALHRPLDDKRYAVDHFFTKLLLLESSFRTERGRIEAQRRSNFMRTFLMQLGTEIGAPAIGVV